MQFVVGFCRPLDERAISNISKNIDPLAFAVRADRIKHASDNAFQLWRTHFASCQHTDTLTMTVVS